MKKIAGLIVVIVLVVLAVSAGVIYWKRLAPPAFRPEALLPAETLLLVEASDLPRSAFRWQSTELSKLWNEPEMQAFLEKPYATIPFLTKSDEVRKSLAKLWPRQCFAAVVSMGGTSAKWIGGFSFLGNEKIAEEWLAEARAKVKSEHPAGKAELVMHGKVEIETYTDQAFVLAEATHKGWHLAANDLALLRATLDRLDAGAKSTAPALGSDEEYRHAFAPLPADADLRLFARTGTFVDRLLAAGTAGDPEKSTSFDGLRKTRAVAAVSKIEGGQMHDAVFALGSTEEKPEPITRGALELTNPETAIFYAVQLGKLDLAALPPQVRGIVPYVQPLEAALGSVEPAMADLPAIFDSELTFLMPKPKGQMNGVLALGLRDAPRAAKLAEAFTAPALGESAWTASDEDGLRVYTAPIIGGALTTPPVLTVTDRYWLLSNTPSSFASLVNRPDPTPQLDHTAEFRDLSGSVVAPVQAFGYFDLGAIFESYYGSLRPLLVIGVVGSEEAGKYIDAGKLPNVNTVVRHLGALVISEGSVPEGTLWEARGNFSLAQLVVSGAAGYFAGGLSLPAGLPGMTPPPPASTPPQPDGPVGPAAPEAVPPPAPAGNAPPN